ncbi:MAG: apolipoprotein N-acyltransferase [Blastocatellia bacterium]|nr:apolipoprotein N-acyltransferase [Blastocatellia bacterium]
MKTGAVLGTFSLAPDGIWWQAMMAVAAALLLLLSFPPFDLNFLAWVALAPLLAVLARGIRPGRAFWLGWLMGLEFTFFAENWIAHSMTHFGEMLSVAAYAVALLFAAILAVFPGLFAAMTAALVRQWGLRAIALSPIVWVATEWLRPWVTGVTWNALGVSQYRYFSIAKLAQVGGVAMIGAELAAGSALVILLLNIWKSGRKSGVAKIAVALVVVATLGFLFAGSQRPAESAAGIRVSAIGVQPNLPPASTDTGRDLENNIALTRQALERAPGRRADLIIWAESPLALFYESDLLVRERLDRLAGELRGHLLLNAMTRTEGPNAGGSSDRYYNSIQIVSPDPGKEPKPLKRYDKIRLVPFGEYVPFNAVLKHIVPRVISSDSGGFSAGREAVVNQIRLEPKVAISLDQEAAIERTTDYLRVGSFICYEAAYPDLVRQFVRNGATVLVNVSNDAWFGNTGGAKQHLAHAVMRAIENDRDIFRVTNAGISALLTGDGRIVDPLPLFTAGTMRWEAQSRRSLTFYARHGDWFATACAIAALALLGLLFLRKNAENPR